MSVQPRESSAGSENRKPASLPSLEFSPVSRSLKKPYNFATNYRVFHHKIIWPGVFQDTRHIVTYTRMTWLSSICEWVRQVRWPHFSLVRVGLKRNWNSPVIIHTYVCRYFLQTMAVNLSQATKSKIVGTNPEKQNRFDAVPRSDLSGTLLGRRKQTIICIDF